MYQIGVLSHPAMMGKQYSVHSLAQKLKRAGYADLIWKTLSVEREKLVDTSNQGGSRKKTIFRMFMFSTYFFAGFGGGRHSGGFLEAVARS